MRSTQLRKEVARSNVITVAIPLWNHGWGVSQTVVTSSRQVITLSAGINGRKFNYDIVGTAPPPDSQHLLEIMFEKCSGGMKPTQLVYVWNAWTYMRRGN
jgi:hypothetical protein